MADRKPQALQRNADVAAYKREIAVAPKLPDKIVLRSTDGLVPFANNARTHSPAQVAQIAASIREFGFTNPVLIDGEDGIIAGHGRVLAAHLLGLAEVPCIELVHLSPTQRRAYVIADNKLALNAGWDDALLALEFEGLKTEGFDVELTGFSLADIKGLGKGLGEGGDAPIQITPESWAVIVDCTDEADQVDLIQRLQDEGRKVRGSIG